MRPSAIIRFLAACAAAAGVTLSALTTYADELAKAASHQVSVSFSPRVITLDQSATLSVTVKNPQGGGNRTGVTYTLVLPAGLTTPGVNVLLDCYESGSGFTATPSTTSVTLDGLSLRPGGTCTVLVTVVASAPGEYSYAANAVNVNSNSGSASNAAGASLTVNPAPPPVAQLSRSSLAFGSQLLGTSGASQSVTLSNTGSGPLFITGISVSGDFSYAGCATSSVPAGGSCTLSITFSPTATGPRSGSIQISTNDVASPHAVALSGTGAAPAAALAPSPLGFGSVMVGASPTSIVTLSNTGGASLAISSIVATGTFFSQTNSCPASLAAGASCPITVAYAPTATGSHSGQLSVQSSAAGSPHSVAISGSGIAPGVSLTPGSVSFGSVAVGASATASVVLTSTGTAPLAISSITVTGANFAQSHSCPASLAVDSSCQITVTYQPGSTGAHSGQVVVQTSAAGAPHSVPLSGAGTAPAVSLAPPSVSFGSTAVNTSAASSVTLANTGSAPLAISGIAATGAFFTQANSCPASLAAGASCQITVTYAPTSAGSHAGQLSVSSNAPGGPHVVQLSGTGTAPGVALSPSPGSFGSVVVGATSTLIVTLANSGAAPLAIAGITATGANFAQTNACPSALAAGASCQINVSFTPPAIGAYAGQVSVQSNAAGSPHAVALEGTGTAPGVSLSPSPATFGSVLVGSSSTVSVVLTNTGAAPLALSAITATGAFFTQTNECPASLASGASCAIAVKYAPTAAGAHGGQLSVQSNATGSPHAVALSGTGTAPSAAVTPPAVGFGNIVVGTSANATLNLANTGSAPLSLSGITISGTFFTQTNACGTSVAAGSTCAIMVTYAPTMVGSHAGQVTIQTNAGTVVASLGGSATPAPAPVVGLSRNSVAFPTQPIGTSSPPQTVTLTNTGNAPLSVGAISSSGDFGSTGCAGSSVPAGGSCTLSIVFAPTAAGPRSGSIQIASNASGGPHAITLSGGLGGAPAAALTPSPVSFAGVVIGTSATSIVTLSNTGSAPLAISSITATGTYFGQANACPASLAAGASCQITVTYAPTATGSHSGQLSVHSNADASAAVAALSGTAIPEPAPALTLSRNGVEFGSQAVGTESAAQTVTLTNTGNAPLSIASLTISGDYSHVGCAVPSSIPAGGSCTLSIVFRPTVGGSRPGSILIASNANGSPHSISLSGAGAISPAMALAPSVLDFGTIPSGSSVLLRVALKSTGTAPLAISSISITGAFFTQTNLCPASLEPGASCDVWVAFAPTATGTHTGHLTVQSNVSGGAATVPLNANATPAPVPMVRLSRSDIDFGAQTIGVASNAQVITVSNPGTATLEILSIAVTGDFGFEGCATPLSLAAGESCALSIKFLPTATGARTGSIAISSNATGSPHSIALTGSGTLAPVPGIAVAPSTVSFGSIIAGTSVVTHLALTNTGTAALAISGISTTMALFTQTNTCPGSLAPSAACDISVTYAPTAAGSHSGELHVVSNAEPSPLVVPLSGNALPALAPALRLSSTSVVFGSQFVGVTSSPKTVTLSNTGTGPLRISNIASTGDFGYGGCGFPATVITGESCVFSITFKPLSVGTLTGAIEVTSDAPGSPHTITLTGTGASFAVPEISLAPSHLAFGPLAIGATATQRMRLTNSGASALEISRIFVTGAFFSQSNACPASLPIGVTCEIVVTYAPTAIGAHSGQIHIESNAVPSPHVAPLSANGIAVPPPFLAVDRSVNFGQQVTGTTARKSLRLANSGGDPLLVTAARILGSPEFGVEGSCTTIAPGASCALDLTFTPTGVRGFGARLDIVSNHSGGVVQVDLAGVGVPRPLPDLELSVGGLGWGNQVVGTLGEERIVKLTSVGEEALRINSIAATPDFVVNANQCPALLQPQLSCDVSVTFKPVVPGPRQGRLTIDSNAAGNPDSVSLTGIGCRFFTMGAARNPSRLCSP